MRPIVTLTTDFGTGAYVAQMKGILLAACREVQIVDVTHAIAPQNILQGAIVLADIVPMYPLGTYHWVVVDPGVGSQRSILYAEIGSWKFVLPDNGLLSLVAEQWPVRRLIRLTNPDFWRPQISPTFHGRDIMASVLGHLLQGVNPLGLGEPTDDMVRLAYPKPILHAGVAIEGEILTIDGFGNAISNITQPQLVDFFGAVPPSEEWRIRLENCAIEPTWCRAYSDQPPDAFVTLIDSSGRLEIAVVNGNASKQYGLAVGCKLWVSRGTSQLEP